MAVENSINTALDANSVTTRTPWSRTRHFEQVRARPSTHHTTADEERPQNEDDPGQQHHRQAGDIQRHGADHRDRQRRSPAPPLRVDTRAASAPTTPCTNGAKARATHSSRKRDPSEIGPRRVAEHGIPFGIEDTHPDFGRNGHRESHRRPGSEASQPSIPGRSRCAAPPPTAFGLEGIQRRF